MNFLLFVALKFLNNKKWNKDKKRGRTKLGTTSKTVNRIRKKCINVLTKIHLQVKSIKKTVFKAKLIHLLEKQFFHRGHKVVHLFCWTKKTKSGFSRFIGTTCNSKGMKLLKLVNKICLKMNVTINLIESWYSIKKKN